MKNDKNSSKREQVSVFREAWQNMSADLSRLLPKRMRATGKTRKVLILGAIVDLVVLGALGKLVYDWLAG